MDARLPVVICPRCQAVQIDEDGFGVQYCEDCGYCAHPSATGAVCDLCSRRLPPDSAEDAGT